MTLTLGILILLPLLLLLIARRPRAVSITSSEARTSPRSLNQEERLRLAILSERRSEERTKPIFL